MYPVPGEWLLDVSDECARCGGLVYTKYPEYKEFKCEHCGPIPWEELKLGASESARRIDTAG